MIFRKKTYTEEELINGCLQNDRRAQEALYKQFFPKMMSMCLKHTKDKDRSLEIINDGFFKVFSKIHLYKHSGSFEGWIRRIMYHSIIDFHRANKSSKLLVSPDELIYESVDEKATDMLAVDDLFVLIGELPQAARDVFLLFAVEGYKHDEIAAALGISSGTSKWHLSNARKLLQEAIRGRKDTRTI